MIIEDVLSFLKKIPPFQFLDENILKNVAGSLSLEYYPKGSTILKQDSPSGEAIWIIKKGGVKVYVRSETGEDVLIDYRGEGDNFGFISLTGEESQKTTVVSIEDTICFILKRDKAMELLQTSPPFAEYFMSYMSGLIERTSGEIQKRRLLQGSTDRLIFTTRVGDIVNRKLVTVSEDTCIQDAANVMANNKISSLIILNDKNLPVGIVTDRDLREKVVAKGRDIKDPVKNIMTISLIRSDANESCFEAVLKMIKYNIHHILVLKDGEVYGVMTNHDLMILQGTSPLSITHNIDIQQNIYGLASASSRITNLLGLLLKEGAKASSIATVMTEINDRVIRKAIEISEKQMGSPPVPYCMVTFGAAGRKEQIFKTDQDNAIIYADIVDSDSEKEVKKYFSDLSKKIIYNLVQTGYPECSDGYMAGNPLWCQPLSLWKNYFLAWIKNPLNDNILKSLMFFDMRPVYGKFILFEELKSYYYFLLNQHREFLRRMSDIIKKNSPPVGFLKSYVIEKSGEHRNRLDLKKNGLMPFSDAIRLIALVKGAKEHSTFERIDSLRNRDVFIKKNADDLKYAFDFLLFLNIHHQFEKISSGKLIDNLINPKSLSNLEKKTLKETFNLINNMQRYITDSLWKS